MKSERTWNRERRVYVFSCDGCHKDDAQTYRRAKARRKLCRICRRGVDTNPNQSTLFDK